MGWGDGAGRNTRRVNKAIRQSERDVGKGKKNAHKKMIRKVRRADRLEQAGCAVIAISVGTGLVGVIATWKGWT